MWDAQPGEVDHVAIVEQEVQVERPRSPPQSTFAALDRYEGPPLADGEASLTLRVTLRPLTRTLTDPETEQYRQSLMKRLEGLSGVRIRT